MVHTSVQLLGSTNGKYQPKLINILLRNFWLSIQLQNFGVFVSRNFGFDSTIQALHWL